MAYMALTITTMRSMKEGTMSRLILAEVRVHRTADGELVREDHPYARFLAYPVDARGVDAYQALVAEPQSRSNRRSRKPRPRPKSRPRLREVKTCAGDRRGIRQRATSGR
jgi:hypothetical protein